MSTPTPNNSKDSKGPAAPIDVGCAIIVRKPHLLIAQRTPGDSMPGFWEFPGGKVESGESVADCIRREVYEEMLVEVRPREIFSERIHQYPRKKLRLIFVLCDWVRGKPIKHDIYNFKWVLPSELNRYGFIPADYGVIYELRRRAVTIF